MFLKISANFQRVWTKYISKNGKKLFSKLKRKILNLVSDDRICQGLSKNTKFDFFGAIIAEIFTDKSSGMA